MGEQPSLFGYVFGVFYLPNMKEYFDMIEKYTLEEEKYDNSFYCSHKSRTLTSLFRDLHHKAKFLYPYFIKGRSLTLEDFLSYMRLFILKDRELLLERSFFRISFVCIICSFLSDVSCCLS